MIELIRQNVGTAIGAAIAMLLMGRLFRTLLIWPFVQLAKWTGNKKADTLVEIAENDLGVSDDIRKLEQAEGDPNAK